MTLPKIERSGVMPKRACAPPSATRKPVMTSSNTSSAPCCVHSDAERVEKTRRGRDEAHVRGDRFDEHGRDLGAGSSKTRVERGDVVVRHDDRVGDRSRA